MSDPVLDYRSDTLTQPTPAMREAIASAEVGDDVFAEDPTVNRLQEYLANLLAKEAALFVPSGSMSNQIAIATHCQRGDEFICEEGCHIYNYEQATYAQFGGVAARPIVGELGVLRPEQLVDKIRGNDAHLVRTRLVCLENTHNRGGGKIQPYDDVEEICRWAHENDLATHLDGARLMNAVVETGIDAATWAQHFDTVSICFSKGLGAPVGSALAGSREFIDRAHRVRKAFGGGMRQAGILAAAALYGLQNQVERLADDHAHAQRLAEAIRATDGVSLSSDEVDTNIVFFDVDPALGTAQQFVDGLNKHGVRMLALSLQSVRAVTHLDVDVAHVDRAAAAIASVADELREETASCG